MTNEVKNADQKVFCLGFQKTGTSSLRDALTMLGYTVASHWQFRDLRGRDDLNWEIIYERAQKVAETFDAAQDTPWPVLYKFLDKQFPGSKFIHVERETGSWIRSVQTDFGKHHNQIHRLIYGTDCPAGNEDEWIRVYERHNSEVKQYFSDRPNDFISLPLSDVGWEPICRFLNHPTPETRWPHSNKKHVKQFRQKWNRLKRLVLGS